MVRVSAFTGGPRASRFQGIGADGRSTTVHAPLLVFFFFQFHLHLFHLLAHAFIGSHVLGLEKHFYSKNEEQDRSSNIGERYRKYGWNRVA